VQVPVDVDADQMSKTFFKSHKKGEGGGGGGG
jgi:hypothetical protein